MSQPQPRARSLSLSAQDRPVLDSWLTADHSGRHSGAKPKSPAKSPAKSPTKTQVQLPHHSSSKSRKSRWDVAPSNPSERNARDVKKARDAAPYARSRTVLNHGQNVMVPSFSSPRISSATKANSPAKEAPGPSKVMPSYAAMTEKSTGGESNNSSPLTPRDKYHLKIFRKDRGHITRDDQWAIQAEACDIMEKAQEEGNAINVIHSGTRMTNRELQIYCTPISGITYKAMALRMGYEATLPGERKPGHPIYGSIPRAFHSKVEEIGKHVAAGTFGAIKASQITVVRKPWWTETSNIFLHLEVDEEAWAWLRRNLWVSSIGLYIIRWSHPPVRNVSGYIAPDANIGELLRGLEGRADKKHLQQEEMEGPSQKTQGLPRSRHVTGADKQEMDTETETARATEGVTAEEEEQLLNEEIPAELAMHRVGFGDSGSTTDEETTLTEISINTSSPKPNLRKRGKKSSDDKSIAAGVKGKTARRLTRDGGVMSSPSDQESN